MTRRERDILTILAERFPASAHAAGGRNLRIRVEAAFPDLDRKKPDDYESFLEAAETLEKEGVVSISWKGRRAGEEIAGLMLTDPDKLYALLGSESPVSRSERIRDLAQSLAGTLTGASTEFFSWLGETFSPRDVEMKTGEPTDTTFRDAASLAAVLGDIAVGVRELRLTRALSVELFSDSKRIEELLRIFQPLVRKAERAGVAVPPFELVDRSFPETLIAGPVRFFCKDGTRLDNPSGMIIGLPFESVLNIESVERIGQTATVLGIENKETFYALAKDFAPEYTEFSLLVYVGGHPNRAVQTLFTLLARSGFQLFHTGDLDPDGILIIQELSDAAGTQVIPWMMDCAVFERYYSQGRTLEGDMHTRALRVRDDTRSRFGLGDLLDRIIATGIGVEQEIITYSSGLSPEPPLQ